MKVEKIRKEMLEEHNMLRGLLEVISDLAERVTAGDTSQESALRESAQQLSAALLQHMESEELHLARLSRGGGPHWALHLNEFKHHHVHQRTLLAHFLERVNGIHTPRRLGEFVQAMVTAVRLDMEEEELALFSAESAGTTTVQGA
jgi:iron-sulfur cluster repair protein YtfE (RIC family)